MNLKSKGDRVKSIGRKTRVMGGKGEKARKGLQRSRMEKDGEREVKSHLLAE